MKLLNDYEKLQNENTIVTPFLIRCKSNSNGSNVQIIKGRDYGFKKAMEDINAEFTLPTTKDDDAIRDGLQAVANSVLIGLGAEPCEVILYMEPSEKDDSYIGSYSHKEGFIRYNLGNFSYNKECSNHVGASVYANLVKLCVERAKFFELENYIDNYDNCTEYERAVNSYAIASKSNEEYRRINNIKQNNSIVNLDRFDTFYKTVDTLSKTTSHKLIEQLKPMLRQELSEIAKTDTKELLSQLLDNYKTNIAEYSFCFDGVVSNKIINSIDMSKESTDLVNLQNALETKIDHLKSLSIEKDKPQERNI